MEKGVDYVIESFARALPLMHRPHRLVIVGDGPERPNLERLAGQLGVGEHVDFVGDTFDVERYLYTSKLLISGLANNPIMEAIATGTPVVAVELGETRRMYGAYPNVHVVDYPPGGCGRIDPDYRESLVAQTAEAIAAVVNDSTLFERANGAHPPLYDWDERLTTELELYDSLFDTNRPLE
jgi:glycosyltransferase involved in cell wall biosynthesis